MKSIEPASDSCEAGNLYRLLPSVNDLLLTPSFADLLKTHSHSTTTEAARTVLVRIRKEISEGQYTHSILADKVKHLDHSVAEELKVSRCFSLRRVINATGVILHTNLGRAPLSASALEHIAETARGYCNLEFDLESGVRSRRDTHAEELILRLLGIDAGSINGRDATTPAAALVVNNCAAATFLALNSLAEGAEVIVSRGELVEIGGGFRIPEILAKSGARMREVGTTNRTRISDYENAIRPETALILRVHQSNFSMEGFTERPALDELVALGRRANIPVFEDQGTGLSISLDELGVGAQPTLPESFRFGADLVAASGDKLLGGPQCGLLAGRIDLIERIRKNPLLRTSRVDKLTYAALEATLMEYLSGMEESIPVVRMLRASPDEILRRCEWVAGQLNNIDLVADVVPAHSLIGGGAAPSARLASSAVALRHALLPPQAFLHLLRQLDPVVIGRVNNDKVSLDLRTVEPEFDATLVSLLQQGAQSDLVSSKRIPSHE
jgi:L-seryl-tRNA(Ser) seleniumtransferase